MRTRFSLPDEIERRRVPARVVGSPLLLKGLEADVAVILDAADFDRTPAIVLNFPNNQIRALNFVAQELSRRYRGAFTCIPDKQLATQEEINRLADYRSEDRIYDARLLLGADPSVQHRLRRLLPQIASENVPDHSYTYPSLLDGLHERYGKYRANRMAGFSP